MKPQLEKLVEGVEELGLPLSDEARGRFELYLERLLEWNKRVNLVSRADEGRIVGRHFLESLALLRLVEFPYEARVLDLGTGAGFPGLPIKILRPDIRMTLLDSRRKRILFLREVVGALGLEGVAVVCARAEEINRQQGYEGQFDIVLARAVAKLERLVRWGLPFLKEGGRLVAVKGGDLDQEIKGLRDHRVRVELVDYPPLFRSWAGDRKVVVIARCLEGTFPQ